MIKTNNDNKYVILRNQYKNFTYESFDLIRKSDIVEVSYKFNLDDKYFFQPGIKIPLKPFMISENISCAKLNNIIFHIGMIELISYWKAACPKNILIKPYYLDNDQIKWWKSLYFNGLGEFFYLNSINADFDDFMNISTESDLILEKDTFNLSDSVVIPVGGGKDSAVTMELLKSLKDNLLLIVNPRKASLDTALAAGYSNGEIIEVNRKIDPVLLKLNDEGFLNGHTPFSALLAFVSLLCAAITGKKNIALSNESSANEPTVEESYVNHQYSKSFQFEKDFREYCSEYITEDINYFSFLRPLNELQIAYLFAESPQYFSVFKSCNAGSKTDVWCGKCPKCLFTFIIFSPFIERNKLIEIFGKDLFDDPELIHYFNELTGIAETKPFECVGTVDEVNASLCTVINNNAEKLPFLQEYYKNTPNYRIYQNTDFTRLLKDYNEEHFLQKSFEDILKKNLYD